MTGAASRRKGNAAETAVAKWLRDNGWPDARTTRDARGGSQGGADITGVTGWAIEVKHHATLEPARWWRQAIDQADDDAPLLIWHQLGVADPGNWVAVWRGQRRGAFSEAWPAPVARDFAAFALLNRPVITSLAGIFVATGSLDVWRRWTR